MSYESRIWALENRVESLKVKLMRLESSIIKLEGLEARRQADKIEEMAKGLEDHEVEPP